MSSKHKKAKNVRPDETFARGPMRVARFGKNVVLRSNWPEGAFVDMQRQAVEHLPTVVREIDALVHEIAILVSLLPPDQLLQRAWWELARRHLKVKAEAELGWEDGIAVRMVDYIQSVIAAVPPDPSPRQEVTQGDWQTLSARVEELFRKVNLDYQICASAKNKADNPDLNADFEEFRSRAQAYWCNVRGSRYQIHYPPYLSDMFLPHSAVLQELFGLTGEQFVQEVTTLWHTLSFGLADVFERLERFRSDTLSALEAKLATQPTPLETDLPALFAETIRENAWEQRQADILGQLLGTDLFDVQKMTRLPQHLLDQLAWMPGEDRDFFAQGDFCGWPLRTWPTSKRPFIRLNGRYYCFDLYSLFDNLYRVVQRLVIRLKPEYQEQWNKTQRSLSEELPFTYLRRLLPEALVYRHVYYRGETESGQTAWCEADGLLIYDDHLFIIESRGGAFTYTPPATDFPAYVASLKNLVLKPATQGKRFLDYLNTKESVPIFDERRRRTAEIRRQDYREITICPVTLDPFTELAAQVQHLRKIGVDVGSHPVWAISVDDLRVYADVFENPLVFLHFVEQRMRAFSSDVVQSDDELDHLGLYLKHNHYSLHAEQMQGDSSARITFTGYRSDIDKFFNERMIDPSFPCPLKQNTPTRLLSIVDWLAGSRKKGRSEVASFLLDLSGPARSRLANGIEGDLAKQSTPTRPRALSIHGESNLTVFCWTESGARRDPEHALAHARTVLLLNGDNRRLLLELSYTDARVLRDVTWHWVDLARIPPSQLPELRAAAEKLRLGRIAKAKAELGKIGRNERCPCGSGRKYKKCCLNR
jgi:hypothetical protein